MNNGVRSGLVQFLQPADLLEYTGERFTSGQGGPIEHEHRHRYLVAASICRDKEVLDIASGEGFGSAFISTVATKITGVDIDPEAVAFAQRNYRADNLCYKQGSAIAIPLPDKSIDVVVSFESIEHFVEHEAFMAEIRRVLRPNGCLLISSPNKGIYPGEENHFHIRELTQDEFVATVSNNFRHLRLFEQKATTGSVITPVVPAPSDEFRSFRRVDDYSYEPSSSVSRPIYSLILASDVELPKIDWGVLDDEGYVAFLQSWIRNSDNHHAALLEAANKENAALLQNARNELEEANARYLRNLTAARLLQGKLIHTSVSETKDVELKKLAAQLETAKQEIEAIKASTSWRVSAPVRQGRRFLAKLRALTRNTGKDGARLMSVDDTAKALRADAYSKSLNSAPRSFSKQVLIIAETSLPQCAKYRVWQKKNAIERLGFECRVIDWGKKAESRQYLQTASAVIFYRVPGWPDMIEQMLEARRLGIPTYWEVDDLIFDQDVYENNGNLDLLSKEDRESVLFGVPLFRDALIACGAGIASTQTIADHMSKLGVGTTFVIQNGLDQQTLDAAERVIVEQRKSKSDSAVVIFYGSGSQAHNADFLEAASAIARVLEERPATRLQIAGPLILPNDLDRFAGRIDRLPMMTFESYLRHLRNADISIAPLERSVFNDAKSNIKFLEASVVAVPSVCSARKTFSEAIEHGSNGFLADSEQTWYEHLIRLNDDAPLRIEVGNRAREHVLQTYSPESIAGREVAPLLATIPEPERKALNVLTANVFYQPQSFGGATIVCEQLTKRLKTEDDTTISVFTTMGTERSDYELVRYDADGVDIFAVKAPSAPSLYQDFENFRMAEIFTGILEAVRPDVVHLHCVQGLSASIADACVLANVPYVITLHDAWWICERQFMVDVNSRYCGQTRINLDVCASCVPNIELTRYRTEALARVLDGAALLLTPSEFFRQLFISNGVHADRIRVNKNGVATPKVRRRPRSGVVRFGFVGGAGPIKGLDQIRRAFAELPESNYELVIVDNTMNLGFTSINVSDWNLPGKVRVRPAYRQSELDDFLSEIDVLLFPSQWKESFGLAVREALIRDIWVLANAAGGVSEDIVEGSNGNILPFTSDHAPLREAIKRLLSSAPEFLQRSPSPAVDRITTYDDQAAELRGMLQEVASKRAGMG